MASAKCFSMGFMVLIGLSVCSCHTALMDPIDDHKQKHIHLHKGVESPLGGGRASSYGEGSGYDEGVGSGGTGIGWGYGEGIGSGGTDEGYGRGWGYGQGGDSGGTGEGSGYGEGHRTGIGSGSGYGEGHGSGSGSSGSGSGYGEGHGTGIGAGGSGSGYGEGHGTGSGYGEGHGSGTGSGYGEGQGSGSGSSGNVGQVPGQPEFVCPPGFYTPGPCGCPAFGSIGCGGGCGRGLTNDNASSQKDHKAPKTNDGMAEPTKVNGENEPIPPKMSDMPRDGIQDDASKHGDQMKNNSQLHH